MDSRKYYEAYDDRYRQAHAEGLSWFTGESSPIVGEIISRYHITPDMKLLELGCGEGRDARPLLEQGWNLLATDISPEAINYCTQHIPGHSEHFQVLDCVNGALQGRFDFIYAVAVIHMLVLDEDRDRFYQFIREHLTEHGLALICSMGDGSFERQSDITTAFELQERECGGKSLLVAGTSCRMVSKAVFRQELDRNGLHVVEMGQTSIPYEFPEMMYALVRRASR